MPDGIITTIAGKGNGSSSGDGVPTAMAQVAPIRIAVDGTGDLFFFDAPNRTVRKVSPDGVINTVMHVGGNDYFVALDRASDLFQITKVQRTATVTRAQVSSVPMGWDKPEQFHDGCCSAGQTLSARASAFFANKNAADFW